MEDPSLRFNHVKEGGLSGCPPGKTVADSKGSTSRGTQSSHGPVARRGVPSWNKQPIGGNDNVTTMNTVSQRHQRERFHPEGTAKEEIHLAKENPESQCVWV